MEIRKTVLAVLAAACLPLTAFGASQDECSIWLCLPGGFPEGCGAAHSAMMSRIRHRHPPLPDFEECAINPPMGSGSHMTWAMRVAAYIPPHYVCVEWQSNGDAADTCARQVLVPEEYRHGVTCETHDGNSIPEFCTRTYRWIDVMADGVPVGPTYYF